jgi:hypothetical protein
MTISKRSVARISSLLALLLVPGLAFILSTARAGQDKQKSKAAVSAPAPAPLVVRTTSRHEVRRLGYGGSVTIVGAPEGRITIEAWPRNEVDITADIELRAESEEDLTKLATIDGFVLDSTMNNLRVLTTGTHDKVFMKRAAKDFPKRLLGIPFKIDYKLKVPANVDLDIDAGRGSFELSGVEGAVTYRSIQSDANLSITGGAVRAVIGSGKVNVTIPARSWRGSGADIQLAVGELNVSLMNGFNADMIAEVLRSGRIENSYPTITPMDENIAFTERLIRGRAGSGGASLSFTVTDGTLRIKKHEEEAATP